jgi:hypothetical protein
MLYQWQLVKNNVIQSNFPGNFQNISDFYVNLRVEVGKHPQVILAMYFYLGQE